MAKQKVKVLCLLLLAGTGGLFLRTVMLAAQEDHVLSYLPEREMAPPPPNPPAPPPPPPPPSYLHKGNKENGDEEVNDVYEDEVKEEYEELEDEKKDEFDDVEEDEYGDEVEDKEENEYEAAEDEYEDDDIERPRVWVLAGSIARSGTSIIGELMSKHKPCIYFFEPELFVRRTTKSKVSRESGLPFLQGLVKCRFSESFVKWLHTRSKGNVVRHQMTRRCRSSSQCHSVSSVTEACLSEQLRIMKVIRIRIRWMRELLSDPSIDLKLVHITRDPRASLRSMLDSKVGKLEPEYYCPLIEDDLVQTDKLQREFPGQVMGFEYEKFCLDPKGQARRLWRFLSDNNTATLPEPWTHFLDKHTHKDPDKPNLVFGTVRNTRQEYEEWRWEIKGDLLTAVEEHCVAAITRLRHRLFGSISVARNASVPLVVT